MTVLASFWDHDVLKVIAGMLAALPIAVGTYLAARKGHKVVEKAGIAQQGSESMKQAFDSQDEIIEHLKADNTDLRAEVRELKAESRGLWEEQRALKRDNRVLREEIIPRLEARIAALETQWAMSGRDAGPD